MSDYYSLEEVKSRFKKYSPPENFHISEGDYETFCLALVQLPKDILDRVEKEVFFILSGIVRGWHIDLECPDLSEKKGLIQICPHLLKDDCDPTLLKETILHEIAHHILGHKAAKDHEEYMLHENEANSKTEEWFEQSVQHAITNGARIESKGSNHIVD